MHTINNEQLKRALMLCWRAGVPVAVHGGVGTGKTSTIKALVKELAKVTKHDFRLWQLMLGFCEPSDIAGVPFAVKDRTTWLPPAGLPFGTDAYGILFLDEYDRANGDTQNASLQLTLGGEVNGNHLGPNVYVVLALNGASDQYTTPLSSAAATRVCCLYLSSQAAGNAEAYDEWAAENGISPLTRVFAKTNAPAFQSFSDWPEISRPTPRTRDMADRVLQAADALRIKTDDLLAPCVCGLLGVETGTRLLALRQMLCRMPPVEEIAKRPDTAALPTGMLGPDAVTYLQYLTAALEPGVLRRYAKRFPAETLRAAGLREDGTKGMKRVR